MLLSSWKTILLNKELFENIGQLGSNRVNLGQLGSIEVQSWSFQVNQGQSGVIMGLLKSNRVNQGCLGSIEVNWGQSGSIRVN
mgnify:CR=1 FL=1